MAGGTYFTTTLFGGHDKEETKTEQVAPAAAPVINLNVDNSSKNMANSGGGATTTIIKEKTIVEKPAAAKEEKKAEKKSETEDSPW